MTLTEQLKILNNNIKANQAQYDLDGSAAKISAISSSDLDKYEYLTSEDLGYKTYAVVIKFLIKDLRNKLRKKDFWKG